MRLHPRRTIPALFAALILIGCGVHTPLAPSSASAATLGASSSPGTHSPIQWQCLSLASTWRPADCPVRSTGALRREGAVSAPGSPANFASSVTGAWPDWTE